MITTLALSTLLSLASPPADDPAMPQLFVTVTVWTLTPIEGADRPVESPSRVDFRAPSVARGPGQEADAALREEFPSDAAHLAAFQALRPVRGRMFDYQTTDGADTWSIGAGTEPFPGVQLGLTLDGDVLPRFGFNFAEDERVAVRLTGNSGRRYFVSVLPSVRAPRGSDSDTR